MLSADFRHLVSGRYLTKDYPPASNIVDLGMGCFWGAEKLFWQLDGVWVTAVGYAGGTSQNPTYEEVCSGKTGHAEVVRVVFDPSVITIPELLKTFWEEHDPTSGMRQGNDIGTQYRSTIFCQNESDLDLVKASFDSYNEALKRMHLGPITTEVRSNVPFYFAEDYHQQYLERIPWGYCGLQGTGVKFQ